LENDAQPHKTGFFRMAASAAGILAAVALVVTNLTTLQAAWCQNIGTFCAQPPAKSDVVSVWSGGTARNDSDECKTHTALACAVIDPKRTPIIASAHFEGQRSGAVYIDGNQQAPKNPDPINTSNIGWFLTADNPPHQICATVYARTSACETKVQITGQLIVPLK
jgi:hypothetical protein